MAERITEILDTVPPMPRPATRNDASTIASLADGLPPMLVDWALNVASSAAEEVYLDVAPARYEVLAEFIGRSIEAISINLVRYLLTGRDTPSAVRVSRAQRQVAVDCVHMHIPLERIIGGLRALDHHWRRAFIELILTRMPGEAAVELLTGVDRSLAIYFGSIIDQNSQIYLDEQQRLLEERMTGQRQLLERVASGQRVEESALAKAFGIRPGDELRLVIVSAAQTAATAGSALDFASYRRVVERRFRSHVVTSIPADGETLWLILSGPHLTDAEVAERLLEIRGETPGAITSFGLGGLGAEGLRRAQHTALAVHTAHRRAPAIGPVAGFAEHGLLALLAQRPDLARWFVEQELGALLTDQGAEDLHRTLRTLIGFNGSLMRTAEALYVHRNTVTYRLKRIEEILGRDPLERPIETYVALLLAEQLT